MRDRVGDTGRDGGLARIAAVHAGNDAGQVQTSCCRLAKQVIGHAPGHCQVQQLAAVEAATASSRVLGPVHDQRVWATPLPTR
jgi:hypothetical protein